MFNTLRTCLHILSVVVLCLSQSPSALAGAQIDETVTYYHYDHLGSIIAASDEAGKLLWQEDYAPYGARLTRENDDRNTLWFTGKPHEDALGLSYFNARWYDPRTARFTGVDPVGVSPENPHSFNRYAYANNNPFKYVDPDGESPLDVVFLIADTVKLGFAVYNGVGIGNAAADLAASAVGLASPLPGVGQAIKAARLSSKVSTDTIKRGGKGGLNLFKWGDKMSTKSAGWKNGDRFLTLRDKGSSKANWKQNSSRLRKEMRQGNPIYDSYRDPSTGQQIPTRGFLNAERQLLDSRGWRYKSRTGAYHPPGN